jgi:hypothetical protein
VTTATMATTAVALMAAVMTAAAVTVNAMAAVAAINSDGSGKATKTMEATAMTVGRNTTIN